MSNARGINALKHDDNVFVSPVDKANVLNDCFKSNFIIEDSSTLPCMNTETLVVDMPNIFVNVTEVEKLLKCINISKAMGPDGIYPRAFDTNN